MRKLLKFSVLMALLPLLTSACSTPNPSPLTEKEIRGLISKYDDMLYKAAKFMENDWKSYKESGKNDGKSVYEQLNNFFKWYYPKRDYNAESPIRYILRSTQKMLAEEDEEFKKTSNNMDFESFHMKTIKIVSIDSFPKIPNAYLVKFKIGIDKNKGHILFKMSKTDDLPYVIDFDEDRNFKDVDFPMPLECMRDIFKIAPYDVTVAYFDYNDSYPLGKSEDLIFNPKNVWELKKDDVQEQLDKFIQGESYRFLRRYEKEKMEEKQKNASTYEYEGVKIPEKIDDEKFEVSFLEFFEVFSKNRDSQIASIHKSLRYRYLDDDYEEVLEMWNEEKLKKNWTFWSDEYFMNNGTTKTIDGTEWNGTWYESSNIIIYKLGFDETALWGTFFFKKNNGKWYLYEYLHTANL
ncbi:MAG: hypothetical protein FWC39_08195 [Bacteroidetes bacterium]|nr:hypothetical protein [Bacteroidota bacterium]